MEEIPPFAEQLRCTLDAGIVMHNDAVLNTALQVTYLNVYRNTNPTILFAGAPARDELSKKNALYPIVNDQCIVAGPVAHPQA